ncbi:TPA: DUF3987 domain-containing protein [Legionella pneumophila]|nr:DUF3987 domain-containing protein [Legionella pneumophila]HAU9905880.1 DUF3987 domain-containing protein [Legionella pneumophila]HAU9927326.1 DUF3987 domain-containing protein [Legionella pneumophila]HAU9930259.1 DUF3987 domain-containing protein [Legionella pneumophila]HAU9933929.1 DUF3987 domain-containing protein [Legionella pneumophila]
MSSTTIEQSGLSSQKKNQSSTWNPPVPLTHGLNNETPYPFDALPNTLQHVVNAYQCYGQQPLSLVACGALANLSLACQTLANVARDSYLVSPVSLYFLVIASSGERKSAADNVFSKAIRKWEAAVRKKREPERLSALTQHKAWQMERDGLLTQIKRAVYSGEDSDYYKDLLDDLVHQEPDIPIQPTFYFEDATQEALAIHLAHGWPSASLWSDEAGIILGSHSMQSNPMRFVALLNRLWEGKSFAAHRKTSQSFIIEHRRLTLNLMMQPLLLDQMISQATGISRQSGFLARCLLAYPDSSMGTRFYQEPPEQLDGLKEYEQRITDCLDQSQRLNQTGCINLPTLKMNAQAKHLWIGFFNSIEAGLTAQGQWMEIKDFASKAAENAVRLAALFHLFSGKTGDISVENIDQAITLMHWYLGEARRLLEPQSTQPNLEDARKLLVWLLQQRPQTTTPRDILQFGPLRNKEQRDNALETLVEHQHIRLIKTGNKTHIALNPWCK